MPLGQLGAFRLWAEAYARVVEFRFCDERSEAGFSWIVAEPATRTSHALAANGRVWLVDPLRFEPALARAGELGTFAGVLQLLDRHKRDCAAIAAELGVSLHVVPDELPGTPFTTVPVLRRRRWSETALWWEATRTLVVPEAIGTNAFYSAGRDLAGVHLLLRFAPPRDALGRFEPDHLLVGHGEGLHGPDAGTGLRQALGHARSGLPRLMLRAPALAIDAVRRRRPGQR